VYSGRVKPQNSGTVWPAAYNPAWHFGFRPPQFHAPAPMYPGYHQSNVSVKHFLFCGLRQNCEFDVQDGLSVLALLSLLCSEFDSQRYIYIQVEGFPDFSSFVISPKKTT
jgi:hypothetical protein